ASTSWVYRWTPSVSTETGTGDLRACDSRAAPSPWSASSGGETPRARSPGASSASGVSTWSWVINSSAFAGSPSDHALNEPLLDLERDELLRRSVGDVALG